MNDQEKVQNYFDALLKEQKTGKIWVNIHELKKKLGVGQAINKVIAKPEYSRMESTFGLSPEEYAKSKKQDPGKFKKWLKDKNITDEMWYQKRKTGTSNQREQWLERFTIHEKRGPLSKKIPKNYISERALSELVYSGWPSTLGQKINKGSPMYEKEVAELVAKLKPTGYLPTGKTGYVRYYKDPRLGSGRILAKLKKLKKTWSVHKRTQDTMKVILGDNKLRSCLQNFQENQNYLLGLQWERLLKVKSILFQVIVQWLQRFFILLERCKGKVEKELKI